MKKASEKPDTTFRSTVEEEFAIGQTTLARGLTPSR
jgi:hypothetical protein